MDYRDRLNIIFGQGRSPSSLRSIFDCDSAEWQGTMTEKKINTLELMVQSGYSLDNWISDYVSQYKGTHPHILRAISKSLMYLSEHSADQELKSQIRKWVISSDDIKTKGVK